MLQSPILHHGLVILAYGVLAVLFTYPLAWHLGSYVVGLEVDAEEYLWSFWWMRKAVLELQANPYFTNWLYYPRGVSLYFFASNPLHAFLSIPLQQLFGLIAAYNLMALLAFAFSGYTMYLLARDIAGRVQGLIALASTRFEARPLQFPNPQDALFGRRIVHLLVRQNDAYLSQPRVLVDLTTGTVHLENNHAK